MCSPIIGMHESSLSIANVCKGVLCEFVFFHMCVCVGVECVILNLSLVSAHFYVGCMCGWFVCVYEHAYVLL